MGKLVGVERDVALDGYMVALQTLFTTTAVVAALATLVQTGTGWGAARQWAGGEEEKVGDGVGTGQAEDEEDEAENENTQIETGSD